MSMVADKTYDNVIKGGLKIKGKAISKNKKTTTVEDSRSKDVICIQEPRVEPKTEPTDDVQSKIQKVIANTVLTESEKAFRIVQIKRSGKTIDNHLKETYGERINKFNRKLAKLPQHFDIPRVGPG